MKLRLLVLLLLIGLGANAQTTTAWSTTTVTWQTRLFSGQDQIRALWGSNNIITFPDYLNQYFIQNQNATVQTGATFRIGGTGEINIGALGTSVTPVFSIINPTAATNVLNQNTGFIHWGAPGWGGSSQMVDFYAGLATTSGSAAPGGEWQLYSNINGGGNNLALQVSAFGTLGFTNYIAGHGEFTGGVDAFSGAAYSLNSHNILYQTADNDVNVSGYFGATFVANSGLQTVTVSNGGSSYTNGTYTNVPIIDLTTGNHTTAATALATVVISGGAVSTITITTHGARYSVGDNLTVAVSNIGGTGSGLVAAANTLHTYTGGKFLDLQVAGGVQLNGINSGTIASGGNLGLDASGNVVKATVSGGGGTTIYTGDGTISGNRVVTNGGNRLTISDSLYVNVTALPPSGGKKMVVFGDSWGAGSVTTDTLHDFVNLVGKAMGYQIINYSVSGSFLEKRTPVNPFGGATTNMIDEISLIPTYSTAWGLAIIEFGVNDWNYGGTNYTPANYQTDYTTVLNAFVSAGWPPSKILICGIGFISPALYGTQGANVTLTQANLFSFNTSAQAVATSFGTMFFDAFPWMQNNGGIANLGNPIHYGNTGHYWYAQGILNILQNQVYRKAQNLAVNGPTEFVKLIDNSHAVLPTSESNSVLGADSLGNISRLSKLPNGYFFNAPTISVSSTAIAQGGNFAPNFIMKPAGQYSGFDYSPTYIVGGIVSGTSSPGSPGTSYTNGTYTNVPLKGGTGTGAVATIIVAGGSIPDANVTITTPGTGYSLSDIMTILPSDVGGTGSGFSWYITSGVNSSTSNIYGIRVGGIAIGPGGGANNATILNNSSYGAGNPLGVNTSGNENTAIGNSTLVANTTGVGNTALGVVALSANNTGSNNTATGFNALGTNTTGENNTAAGVGSMQGSTTQSNSTAVGVAAGQGGGGFNNSIGVRSGHGSTSLDNQSFGYQANGSTTSGSDNEAIGYNSLFFNTDGSSNVALGTYAGLWYGGGTSNNNLHSNNSIFIGERSEPLGASETNEIAIGYQTTGHGSNTAAWGNTSITNHYFAGSINVTGNINNNGGSGIVQTTAVYTNAKSVMDYAMNGGNFGGMGNVSGGDQWGLGWNGAGAGNAFSAFSLQWDASGHVILPNLTASTGLALDGSKNIISTSFLSKPHTIFTPATGGTVALVNNQYNIINPTGALLTLTVNLPSSPANNDCVYIKFTQNVTTVTYGNGTVVDGITAPTAGGLTVLTYDSGTTSWY